MTTDRAVRRFSNHIERGNINNITLTIYYRDARTTFHFPQSVDDFVGRRMYESIIVVTGVELSEHKELLQNINADNLVPVTYEVPMLVMLYYEFAFNGRRLFGVVPLPRDYDSRILINGIEYEWDSAFFNIIKPFLPENSPWRLVE